MQKLKTIGLTLFLTIGLIIPSCNKDSCDGLVSADYFDVYGISLYSETHHSSSGRLLILPGDTVSVDELKVYIDYLVDYVVFAQPKLNWTFSFMSTANACSPVFGTKGSKEEALVNFSVITLNDFDTDHLANTDITNLFEYNGHIRNHTVYENPIPLTQFLDEQTGNLEAEDMVLKLKKAPEINPEFKVKVVMELSTGEIFEEESEPIIIIP